MAIEMSDNRDENHPKPVYASEKKMSGSNYVDWGSQSELTTAVPVDFRRNKYFWIQGFLNYCTDDGVTFRVINTAVADFHSAIPTTNPASPKDGSVYYPIQPGTYTNFKDQSNAALTVSTSDGFVYFVYNGTYWTKVAGPVTSLNTDSITSPRDSRILPTTNNFLTSTGTLTANASYICTDYYAVTPGQQIIYTGITNSAAAFHIAYYDTNKVFVSTPLAANATYTNQQLTIPASVFFIRMSSRIAAGDSYCFDNFYTQTVAFLTSTGTLTGNTVYRCTDFINVTQNQNIIYSGVSGSTAAFHIAYYDINKVFVSTPLAANATYTNRLVVVPAGIAYVRISSKVQAGDVYNFKIIYYPDDPKTVQSIINNTAAITQLSSKINVTNTAYRDYANELLTNYYLSPTGGLVSASNYVVTDFVSVVQNQTITYSGVSGSATTAYPMAYYDTNKAFVSLPLPSNATYTNTLVTIPAGVAFVRMSSRTNAGDVYTFKVNYYPDDPKVIQTVSSNSQTIFNMFSFTDYSNATLVGYIDKTNGNYVSGNASFIATDFLATKPGFPVQYLGYSGIPANSNACSVAWYDANRAFVSVGLSTGTYASLVTLTVPITNPAIAYVRMSATTLAFAGYDHKFLVGVTGGSSSFTAPTPPAFMPPVGYGKQGDTYRLYPFGILGCNILDRGTEVLWNLLSGTLDYCEFIPGSSDDNIAIILTTRDISNARYVCGTNTLKVTHTTKNPDTFKNIICIGDSVTKGTNSSLDPNGAWVNEFSRRLTGVGSALPTSVASPASNNLTNITVRGTLGSLTVKHEGRGGWSISDYLTTSAGNAFWNPGTSKFDLAYYLQQNNFNAAQITNGVDATGSNLVLFIYLGWNDSGQTDVDTAGNNLRTMLDIIHTSHSACQIKLLGLASPPGVFYRTVGNPASAITAMIEKVIPFAQKWQTVANERSSYVEFLPVAPFFNPTESFPTTAKKIHNRTATTINYMSDYIHPNDTGYAQIADVAYYAFLYNYCRAT